MCVDMRINMRIDMHIDMCVDMRTDMIITGELTAELNHIILGRKVVVWTTLARLLSSPTLRAESPTTAGDACQTVLVKRSVILQQITVRVTVIS